MSQTTREVTCSTCGAVFSVTSLERANEIALAMSQEHKRVSPECQKAELRQIK